MDKPNAQLCEEFRKLLTEGFYAVDDDGVILADYEHDSALTETKPWRSELWKKFREIEDRLCPVQARNRILRRGS